MPAHPKRSRRLASVAALLAVTGLAGPALGQAVPPPQLRIVRHGNSDGVRPSSARSPIERARSDALRLVQRLAAMHAVSPEVVRARRDFGHAWNAYYRARTDALADLRGQPDFLAARREIWDRQRQVEGYHSHLPRDPGRIHAEAGDLLELRASLSKREREALENDLAVEIAREEMNAAFVAYLRAVESAADAVRNDPAVVEATNRLRSARASMAGAN